MMVSNRIANYTSLTYLLQVYDQHMLAKPLPRQSGLGCCMELLAGVTSPLRPRPQQSTRTAPFFWVSRRRLKLLVDGRLGLLAGLEARFLGRGAVNCDAAIKDTRLGGVNRFPLRQ